MADEDRTGGRNAEIEETAVDIIPKDEGTKAKDNDGAKAAGDKGTGSEDEDPEKSNCVKGVVCSLGFLLLLGLMAIAIDPLFFYLPTMKIKSSTCLGLDKTLMIVAVILRTSVDILHDCSWWSKHVAFRHFRFAFTHRPDRVTMLLQGIKDVLIVPPRWQNIPGGFTEKKYNNMPGGIIIISSLPLPQVMVLALDLHSDLNKWLKVGVLCQFIPRIFRIYPTYAAITSDTDMNAWAGATFNLVLYGLASHAIGSIWYLCAVDRKLDCMKEACRGYLGCTKSSLYCESGNYAYNGFIDGTCSTQQTSNVTKPFDYGLYSDAIESNLIGTTSFIKKFTHGFWWGLRNLSSMASDLNSNDRTGDTWFAILICILGLILIALLIGNLQVYLQSGMPYEQVKVKWKLKSKRKALEKWGPIYNLPPRLREEVFNCKHSVWLEAGEVNIESLLNDLPGKLGKKIRQHFCKNMFEKVEEFKALDKRTKQILRERAEPVVYPKDVEIHRKGKRVSEIMIYIVRGSVSVYNDNDKNKNGKTLRPGASFGNELFSSALEKKREIGYVKSGNDIRLHAKQTVKSKEQVDAFALKARHFKYI